METTAIERYYTLNEISERLSIPTRTLRAELKKGALTAHKIAGKWRTSESELKSYINAAPTNCKA